MSHVPVDDDGKLSQHIIKVPLGPTPLIYLTANSSRDNSLLVIYAHGYKYLYSSTPHTT